MLSILTDVQNEQIVNNESTGGEAHLVIGSPATIHIPKIYFQLEILPTSTVCSGVFRNSKRGAMNFSRGGG